MDFEICNFVDRFMPKYIHYTLTKIQKVKKHNSVPLTTGVSNLAITPIGLLSPLFLFSIKALSVVGQSKFVDMLI